MGLTYEKLEEYWESNNGASSDSITSSVSGVSAITNRVYNKPHTFLDESFDIRHGWFNPTYPNSYLIPHSKESSDNYNIRKSFSTYKNFLKQIINTTVEPLFKNKFKFEVPMAQMTYGIAATNFINRFNIKLFTMETMKYFELHDLTYTIVEPQSVDSMGIDEGIPKIYNVKIENIRSDSKLDVNDKDLFTEIVFRMDKVYIDKDKNIYVKYFTVTEYKQDSFITITELYKDKEGNYYNGDNKPKKDNDLIRLDIDDVMITDFYYETLPVIEFKSKIDTTRETTPEMHDLAIACWDYYNTNSLYKEIERKATFPMLTINSTSQASNITIGVNNALVYGEGMTAPKYLELDISAHQELRIAKSETRQEIYKLFLQGLQTDETKFTSAESAEVSESLFFNKVNFLSEYLVEYTVKLFANVIYVLLDGKSDIETLENLSRLIEMNFDFDFDMNREANDINFYKLLGELAGAGENPVIYNKLIEAVAGKIELTEKTDKTLQE